MYCQKCGKQIDNDVAFCPYCGNPTANAETAGTVSQQTVSTAVPTGSEEAREKRMKNVKKIGIVVIALLIIIAIVRSCGGRTEDKEDKTEASILEDILGDWEIKLQVSGPGSSPMGTYYASDYAGWYCNLRIEERGITANPESDRQDYKVGVENITVQEENGITYYTYSAKLSSRMGEAQTIGIRLYFDAEDEDCEDGRLVCEYNVPEDGFWAEVARYERVDGSAEE